MGTKRIGVIMNGVTGRMGTNQHLVRSILAIRAQGGVVVPNGDALMPDPILVGRNAEKVRALAAAHGIERWSTDLDACLRNPEDTLYFDAQTTDRRAASVRAAIAAGKHVYCEKPIATDLPTALELVRLAREAGIKNGVVQDKLFLPGLRKLKRLVDGGFFGRIFAVRGEFGYWVFEGDWQPAQRPSWNYRVEEGGGIILDMLCHWRYVLDNTFAPVRAVSCIGGRHIPYRVDEAENTYPATAEDAAYATFQLDGGIIAQINSSWATRVYRDELFVLQVDGTEGSAVAGLRGCKAQHRANTPKPVWNPDVPNPYDFRSHWMDVPDNEVFDNGFKVEWEQFLRHVACDAPFPYGFLEGAKGVQLAEAGLRSWEERCWVDLPELSV
ncbi:MAG TPA: Gfo/Idh/MocA family oxidoreductase [Thermomicrobiales bacterium]|jgi:predicted dehydrogenase